MPPAPVTVPEKTELPPAPVDSVAAPKANVPPPLRVPMRSAPPKAKVAPLVTVTAGRAVRRSVAPVVNVPVSTFTDPTPAWRSSTLAPLLLSAPVPSRACTAPLSSA